MDIFRMPRMCNAYQAQQKDTVMKYDGDEDVLYYFFEINIKMTQLVSSLLDLSSRCIRSINRCR